MKMVARKNKFILNLGSFGPDFKGVGVVFFEAFKKLIYITTILQSRAESRNFKIRTFICFNSNENGIPP